MSDSRSLKKLPVLLSDDDAEKAMAEDLSGFDLSSFQPTVFEFSAKDARINMRLPETLLAAVKAAAKAEGMPYQRYVRQVLEAAVGKGR